MDLSIWPASAQWTEAELSVGGMRASDAVAEYGSPVYLLDEVDFRARCRMWRRSAGSDAVHYAGKALLTPAIATWLAEEGVDLDVCSPGEFAVARRGGFPSERMFLHGNNKRDDDLKHVVTEGIGCIVLDSIGEIERVGVVAGELAFRQKVMLRLATGQRARTHQHLATAHYDQKFGIPIEDGLGLQAVSQILKQKSLTLIGLHVHIGSQVLDQTAFTEAAETLARFALEVSSACGIELDLLDMGGGYGVPYRDTDPSLDIAQLVDQIRSAVREIYDARNLKPPRLAFEPGRSIVGPSVVSLYRVGTVKQGWRDRTYVSVDGGMSDNPRPAMYGARYSVALASRISSAPPTAMSVCGEHCEAGDVLVPDALLPGDVRPGDILAIPVSGAYQRSMASNYNYVVRPAVVAVRDGVPSVLIRRETVDDLLHLFPEP